MCNFLTYWKASLELFVNIDFDFALERQKKYQIFKVLKQSNFIVVEVFIAFRRVRIL